MHKFVVYIHWVLTNAYAHVAPIKIYITITPKFPHVPSNSLKSECIFPQMIKFKNKIDFLLSKMKKKKSLFYFPFPSPNIVNFCRYIPGISLWIIVSSTERKSRMVVKILEPDRQLRAVIWNSVWFYCVHVYSSVIKPLKFTDRTCNRNFESQLFPLSTVWHFYVPSLPQFPPLKDGGNNNTFIKGQIWGLNEVVQSAFPISGFHIHGFNQ